MLLHYLGKHKLRNFALFMHVKHVSSVTFVISPTDTCHSDVMKISAKINTVQITTFYFLFVHFLQA